MMITERLCHVDTCQFGCTRQSGCQGLAWKEVAPAHYRQRAEELIAEMASDGLVLTVEQQSLQPFAMGHYETVVSIRRARGA